MSDQIWNILPQDMAAAGALAEQCGLSALAAGVLAARGYQAKDVSALLGEEQEPLHDPLLLRDMDRAVSAVREAVENGEMICVFGDYDCDGIASTAMVYDYLLQIGARACYYIPNREKEGYGLNKKAVRELAEYGVGLILTVDNGVSAIEEVEYAASLGVKVVVTDHHKPRETLPDACAVVDPHRADCPYPFQDICGAGVAFKLLSALENEAGYGILEEYGDLLAIGTIADVVELRGENRLFVRRGLELLRESRRPGVQALLRICSLDGKALTAESVAFGLAPRMNAAGRIDSAETAVMLLLTESESEAEELAARLDGYNKARRDQEAVVVRDIAAKLAEDSALFNGRLLVLDGEGWNAGIVGIVCSRLVERFGKPCIIIACNGETAKGSGRSVPGFSLIDAVSSCAKLLTRFGGHPMAAGFSLAAQDIPAFREQLERYAASVCPEMPPVRLTVDFVVSPALLTVEQVKGLSLLEPFGCGNEPPVFAVRGAALERVIPLSEGKHCKLRLTKDGVPFFVLCFSVRPEQLGFSAGDSVDIAFSASLNEYQGETGVSLKCKGLCLSGEDLSALHHSRQRYEGFLRGEYTDASLLPGRGETALVYRFLRDAGRVLFDPDVLYRRLRRRECIDYVHFRLAIDILLELNVLKLEERAIFAAPAGPKVDLGSSVIVRRLLHNV